MLEKEENREGIEGWKGEEEGGKESEKQVKGMKKCELDENNGTEDMELERDRLGNIVVEIEALEKFWDKENKPAEGEEIKIKRS